MMVDFFLDSDREVYARVEGSTFHFREILRAHSGRFVPGSKHWECNQSVLNHLLPLVCAQGIPCIGNFNVDNMYTAELVKLGYKKGQLPENMPVEDDAEAWEYP